MSNLWNGLKKYIPKFDTKRTEDKLKLFILISGLLILLGAGSATAVKLTMSPQFCSSCHEMTPEYRTWQVTSHSNVQCTKCHIEPGLVNLITHKVSAVKELYFHFTDSYDRPIAMGHQIENYVCEQCHSPQNRNFTVSGDLIIPHDRHSEKGIKCVSCHSGVAHGDIASRGVTTQGKLEDLGKWTIADGQQQTSGKYARPKMNACIECHTSKKITIKCEACHTSIAIPQNHETDTWGTGHGKLAREDINYCNKCHSYSNEGSGINTGNKIADYARGNALCYNCHQKLPDSHGDEWKINHKYEARKDKVGCLICHNQEKPADKDRATKTYCAKCHRSSSSSEDPKSEDIKTPGPGPTSNGKAHTTGWIKKHPQTVKDIGTIAGKCYECHERTACYRCHTSGGKN